MYSTPKWKFGNSVTSVNLEYKVLHSLTYQQRIIFLISTLDFLTLIHLSRVFRNTELRDQDKAHNTWDLEVNSETLYSETEKKVFFF